MKIWWTLSLVSLLLGLSSCGTDEPPAEDDDLLIIITGDTLDDGPDLSGNNGGQEPSNNGVDPGNNGVDPNNNGGSNNANNGTDPDPVDPVMGPNYGWIGGECGASVACDYDGAICLLDHPEGQCSMRCSGICPDRDGENSRTFCIAKGGEGRCVSMCDLELYPGTGCRAGYFCQRNPRIGEPTILADVCVPNGTPEPGTEPDPDPDPEPQIPCLDQLTQLGVNWTSWGYQTEYTDGMACTIDDPIRVTGPINGIDYRYFSDSSPNSSIPMACDLALSLYHLADILDDHDINEVIHMGTFNCRKISGTDYVSMHGYGLAIDFWGFEDTSGTQYVVQNHFEKGTNMPQTAKGQVLWDIVVKMYQRSLYNIILTPNFNEAHYDHIHVDLTPGAQYIGSYSDPSAPEPGCH